MCDREKIKKQYELLEEIESLESIVERASNRGNKIHFELVNHYGKLCDSERRDIDIRHNNRIIKVLKEIVLELGDEILKLN